MNFTVADITDATVGRLLTGRVDADAGTVSTDTRRL